MPLWNKTNKIPVTMNRKKKRRIIATDLGFVHRVVKYNSTANTYSIKDELLVPLRGVANTFGAPGISDVWFANASITANTVATFYMSLDEPIAYANSTVGTLKLGISNTSGGAAGLFAVSNTAITGANNTLTFTFTPTVAGTYAITGNTTMTNATSTAITSLKSTNIDLEAITLTVSVAEAALAGSLTVV